MSHALLGLGLVAQLGLGLAPPDATTAPDAEPAIAGSEADAQSETASLRGRVRERGASRAPVSGAVVLVVAAPADVRPGRPAMHPLDPDMVTWTRRAETDAEGRFVLDEVPTGMLRVIVVGGGYQRLEQWAALEPETAARDLELYVEPETSGAYRTVVETERVELELEARDTLDAQVARTYPGSGDDPVLATMSLPRVARSPGGFGLLSLRGGDPSEVGVYIDGHPVPRAFHTVPLASVVSPPMIAEVSLSPGNYAVNYGGFAGGLVEISSRAGRRDGIHGEAHLDLFDVGATSEGPVGDGSIHVGVRRSHVGDVLRATGVIGQVSPNYWDYLTRFDYPLGRGHAIGLRGLGASDRLELSSYFDFRAAFHRFDFEYTYTSRDWKVLVSPSLRLDQTTLETESEDRVARRVARVYSLRVAARWQREWFAFDFGADAIGERWHRRQAGQWISGQQSGVLFLSPPEQYSGVEARVGAWFSTPMRLGRWRLIPGARVNVFSTDAKINARADPRLDLRGPVDARARLLAAVGMYGIPVVGARTLASNGYFAQGGPIASGVADVPPYLLTYFDPNLDGESVERYASASAVYHASVGVEIALPWALDLRALGFWREASPVRFDPPPPAPSDEIDPAPRDYPRQRSMGVELLLRRALAPGIVEGWLGYTLMWARVEDEPGSWLPAIFDQRHNFVTLLSFALPRGFRVGLRFRLVSGNPESPVTGREIIPVSDENIHYEPLRAPRGTRYMPLFHQLDIRVDKLWTLDRATVGAYLDVQNVYNRWYPEFWIYSRDWSARQQAIGLPIYPSLGVSVRY